MLGIHVPHNDRHRESFDPHVQAAEMLVFWTVDTRKAFQTFREAFEHV